MFKLWILDLCLATEDWERLIERTWRGTNDEPARLPGLGGVMERAWDDFVMLG